MYLALLVDELNLLWKIGVKAFDANENADFTLKAILMWTINDFPAYGNLSGCFVKRYFGCPICSKNMCSQYLKHSKKVVYMRHKRFLPQNNPCRKWKEAYNDEQENDEMAPEILSWIELENKLSAMMFKPFGNTIKKRKKTEAWLEIFKY